MRRYPKEGGRYVCMASSSSSSSISARLDRSPSLNVRAQSVDAWALLRSLVDAPLRLLVIFIGPFSANIGLALLRVRRDSSRGLVDRLVFLLRLLAQYARTTNSMRTLI